MNAGIMLSVHRVIAAPPEAAWRLLTDLDAWPQWGPTLKSAELDQPFEELTLHATGRVQTPVGVTVPFEVTEFDPGRHWAWKVAGVPATGHRVDPADGGARVAMDVPLWAAAYLTVCALALRRIEKLLLN
jgi:uncharacterized protein YndB with AHSA1/START domain